jgi:hypothetical protein
MMKSDNGRNLATRFMRCSWACPKDTSDCAAGQSLIATHLRVVAFKLFPDHAASIREKRNLTSVCSFAGNIHLNRGGSGEWGKKPCVKRARHVENLAMMEKGRFA